MDFVVHYSWLIPLLPLIGACVSGFLGAKFLKGQSHWPIWLGVGASAVLSLTLLFGMLGHAGGHETAGEHAAVIEGDAGHAEGDPVALTAGQRAERLEAAAGHAPVRSSVAVPSKWYTWIAAGDPADASSTPLANAGQGFFEVSAGAWLDPLSAVMLSVVCGIGFLITIFSAGYMKGEAGYFRFFAYLGLFIFAMTNLVMGDNLILLYLGWEGVGLCSYLLIGYYYEKPAAREAAKKAFLVNRVGDFGFAIGIMLVFYCFGTVSYFGDGTLANRGFLEMAVDPAAYVPAGRVWLVDLIPFALMLGAFGKSAQFPLYVWLPDAMEGPTPVSALIHAATMVTAGVYMIARLSTLFVANEAAMITIAAVGAFTALFAGSIALRQFDLKKVFAYSTVSQLGFMFCAVGVLAPVAGVFHLVTHAFFKALLFLSSGVVMHAMNGHLDLRKMSGLKHQLPKTRILCLIGCAALSGFPLITAGFWSKDEIVDYAGQKSILLWVVLLAAAFMTAYYTFRLYFRVFEGPEVVPTGPAGDHAGPDEPMARQEAVASDSAVRAGDVYESGVDEGVAHDKVHHPAPDHAGHGHAGHGHDDHGHHGHHGHHDHEPWIMIAPLAVLALGAVLAGFINTPLWHGLGDFLGRSPSFQLGFLKAQAFYGNVDPLPWGQPGAHGEVPWLGLILGSIISLAGIGTAWFFHLHDREAATRLAGHLKGLTRAMEGKYWVDEAYQYGVVEPLRFAGRILAFLDKWLIDGLVTAVAWVPQLGGWGLKLTTQRGRLQGYAVTMLIGVAVILLFVFNPFA